MREHGIRIEMPEETQVTRVRAHNLCDVCTFTEQFDAVLLLMKAYDALGLLSSSNRTSSRTGFSPACRTA